MKANRGQAFTLEGLVAAVLLLTAVLLALQTVVVTPSTGGDVDQETRMELRQQANDVLSVSADAGELSYLVRFWNGSPTELTFAGAENPTEGYLGPPPGQFGELLDTTFRQEGHSYNVYVEYRAAADPSRTERLRMVYRGRPDDAAVAASYRVTLYDNMTLTAPGEGGRELWQYDTDPRDGDGDYYPIPNAVDGPVYNTVEVRIVVW